MFLTVPSKQDNEDTMQFVPSLVEILLGEYARGL